MGKINNLYFFIVFFFYSGCKSQKQDYTLVHSGNGEFWANIIFIPTIQNMQDPVKDNISFNSYEYTYTVRKIERK